ncbi:hypothetical protein EJ06DRAFT_526502 [Trichodelitschia bisporula]|uniref:Amino acid transporter transmembrane domain-containing protein n=1 Tax=Trichodelitschia bisporula TaxID=703511 RepID=A0A6G1I8B5_9PEZI|nr:hypothetical protein EJ06DRAFT_526502 [Trichodelitschia bisporula]
MNVPNKPPPNWDDYERGGRVGSVDTTGSHIQWSEDAHSVHSRDDEEDGYYGGMRRRRSSMTMRLSALRQAGGVNSIDNFARSWQRAAGFHEITPVRPAFRFESEDDAHTYAREDIAESPEASRSLLRDAFDNEPRHASDGAVHDDDAEGSGEQSALQRRLSEQRLAARDELFSVEPSLASAFGGSYGTMYGSMNSRLAEPIRRHAARLVAEQQIKDATPDKERTPLIVKQVEEDGVIYNVVVGQSTLPQTIFNSVNVLIGVGLLSLPLGLKYSGWVVGMIFFAYSAITTKYTAKLLAKCLDVDNSLITFADLAFVSFGSKARLATSLLFTIELVAACVALVVLFADSLDALIPGVGALTWKLICCVVLIPLSFLPLRLLSFTSILGVMCCFGIVAAVFIDGLVKAEAPGSLRSPAKTYLFPQSWLTLPLAFGLLMSPWGGHSVFPNIYRDMRHPYKYHRGVDITYAFTYLLDTSMAVAGLLMFGDEVSEEITSNILRTAGYPNFLSVMIVAFIAIIPLTKIPLNARPIVTTIEVMVGLDSRAIASNSGCVGLSALSRGLLKGAIRVITTIVFVAIAIVFPSFDRIMTFLGAVCCFTICIILPLAFHLKLFGKELGRGEWWMNWVLIVISAAMASVSTVFACLPKELLGA